MKSINYCILFLICWISPVVCGQGNPQDILRLFGTHDILSKFREYQQNVMAQKKSNSTENAAQTDSREELLPLFDKYSIYYFTSKGCVDNKGLIVNGEIEILFKAGTCLPDTVQVKTSLSPQYSNEVIYKSYDSNNNVAEIIGKDGMSIFFIWGYRNQFPIAKIENATRQQVAKALGYGESGYSIFNTWATYEKPTTDVWAKLNSLRKLLPDARVTTYEYRALQGVVAITEPNGFISKFDYDNYSRLVNSSFLDIDEQKKMLKQYIYNFIRQ